MNIDSIERGVRVTAFPEAVPEIFDSDEPFTPRGCIAQASTVAQLLRAWMAT